MENLKPFFLLSYQWMIFRHCIVIMFCQVFAASFSFMRIHCFEKITTENLQRFAILRTALEVLLFAIFCFRMFTFHISDCYRLSSLSAKRQV